MTELNLLQQQKVFPHKCRIYTYMSRKEQNELMEKKPRPLGNPSVDQLLVVSRSENMKKKTGRSLKLGSLRHL